MAGLWDLGCAALDRDGAGYGRCAVSLCRMCGRETGPDGEWGCGCSLGAPERLDAQPCIRHSRSPEQWQADDARDYTELLAELEEAGRI